MVFWEIERPYAGPDPTVRRVNLVLCMQMRQFWDVVYLWIYGPASMDGTSGRLGAFVSLSVYRIVSSVTSCDDAFIVDTSKRIV
jgi:hypothetical protein